MLDVRLVELKEWLLTTVGVGEIAVIGTIRGDRGIRGGRKGEPTARGGEGGIGTQCLLFVHKPHISESGFRNSFSFGGGWQYMR